MRPIGLGVTESRTRCAVVLAILVLVSGGIASKTLAFNEPEGFRGVPWGTTEEELLARLRIDGAQISCGDYPPDGHWIAERACNGAFLLDNIRLKATYGFRAGKFTRVFLQFPSNDFNRIAAIFVERYGASTRDTANAKTWVGPAAIITMTRHSSAMEGNALITTRADWEESARLRKEKTKGAAKDL